MHLEELRTLLARHARPDWTTAINGVLISKVDRPDPPAPSMSGRVLAVIARGAKRLAPGHRVYEYRAGQYLVTSVDLPVTGQFTQADPGQPALGFGLILEPSAVAELLLQAGPGDTPRTSAGAPPGVAVSDAQPTLLDAVVRLLRLLDEPRDRAVLAPLVNARSCGGWSPVSRARRFASSAWPTAASATSPGPCAGSASTTRSPSGSRTWRGYPA
jgi:hypothetical protein